MRLEDLSGQIFGRLTGIRRVENVGRQTKWLWKCECGKETISSADKVKSGHTTSCGCYAHEVWTKHGHAYQDKKQSSTYHAWAAMCGRVHGSGLSDRKNYLARGIKICERWRLFSNFLADMGERPNGLSLDRIDNDGDYEPGNCRWATRIQQMANTRKTIRVDADGEVISLKEASRRANVPYQTVLYRFKRGMTPQEALTK